MLIKVFFSSGRQQNKRILQATRQAWTGISVSLSSAIREIRIIGEFRQREAAQCLSTTRSTYCYYENGKIPFKIKQLHLLSNYYHVSFFSLIYEQLFADSYAIYSPGTTSTLWLDTGLNSKFSPPSCKCPHPNFNLSRTIYINTSIKMPDGSKLSKCTNWRTPAILYICFNVRVFQVRF